MITVFWWYRKKNLNYLYHHQLVKKSMWWPLCWLLSQKETWFSSAISSHKAGAHAWKAQAQQSHSWHATSGPADGRGTQGSTSGLHRLSHAKPHDPWAQVFTHHQNCGSSGCSQLFTQVHVQWAQMTEWGEQKHQENMREIASAATSS